MKISWMDQENTFVSRELGANLSFVQGPVARHGLHLVHHSDHPLQPFLVTAHAALLPVPQSVHLPCHYYSAGSIGRQRPAETNGPGEIATSRTRFCSMRPFGFSGHIDSPGRERAERARPLDGFTRVHTEAGRLALDRLASHFPGALLLFDRVRVQMQG